MDYNVIVSNDEGLEVVFYSKSFEMCESYAKDNHIKNFVILQF